ncbi:MAG: site-2 protease family protein, partial [Pseudonocardia sp.]
MPATVPLGRVAGIAVTARWSALAGTALIGVLLSVSVLPALAPGYGSAAYALAGGLAAVGFGVSLLAHELAHSVVARRARVEVRGITLWLLGGVSELATPPRDPAAEVRIALAGPATSVALGILTGAVAAAAAGLGTPALPLATLSWLATMNLVLGVFNLLPGTPLDGGRVLHGVVWRHCGDRVRATRIASTAGRVLGAVLAGLGAILAVTGRLDGLWLVLVGWFIAGSAAAESDAADAAQGSARLAGLRVADAMSAPATPPPDGRRSPRSPSASPRVGRRAATAASRSSSSTGGWSGPSSSPISPAARPPSAPARWCVSSPGRCRRRRCSRPVRRCGRCCPGRWRAAAGWAWWWTA